jgi:hypothetical protein
MKTVFLKAVGFGAGFARTIIIAVGLFVYVSSLPRPEAKWNENAVTASFTELTFTTGENVVLDFSFTLENMTDRDYTLPNDEDSLYAEMPGGKGLYPYNNSPDPFLQNVTIDSSVIPASDESL